MINRDQVRLEIGDTDVDPDADALFSDEAIDGFLARYGAVGTDSDAVVGTIKSAAADACDALANRFAREFDFSEDGQSFSRSQRSRAYADRARQLRDNAAGFYSVKVDSSITAAASGS